MKRRTPAASDAVLPLVSSAQGCFAQGRMEPLNVTVFRGWSRLTTSDHGELGERASEGFFVAETQLVSHFRILLNGCPLDHRFSGQNGENRWTSVAVDARTIETGDPPGNRKPKGSLELRLLRQIDGGWTDRLELTNHDCHPRVARLELEVCCPIGDLEMAEEMKKDEGGSCRKGVRPLVRRLPRGFELRFEKEFGKRAHTPTAVLGRIQGEHAPRDGERVRRAAILRFRSPASASRARFSVRPSRLTRLRATLRLAPGASALLLFEVDAEIDGVLIHAPGFAPPPLLPEPVLEERSRKPADPVIETGNSTLNLILAQARRDLESLRLPPFNRDSGPDGLIAGVPRYVGIFSRDILIAAWQATLLNPRILPAALTRIGEYQGVGFDPWRDEEPGRLPHEYRLNPDAAVGKTNRDVYYGDVTSTPFWIIGLRALWDWTGEREVLVRHRRTLQGCFDWLSRRLAAGGGFVYYAPACPEVPGSNRNQAWKDSGDAIVDERGKIRLPPLALAEIQDYAHQALVNCQRFFEVLGDEPRARRAREQAVALKEAFNREFWMPRERFVSLALDGRRRPLRTIASNAGHCLGTGILDRNHAAAVAARLMAEDMFSGWGVRTLSSRNPSFDPFSYHRGSVWPVENATIAAGLSFEGFKAESNRIAGAQLALATLFQHMRLPELVSGHPRASDCPLPGLYPYANPLQAWSVSSVSTFLQSMLGLQPDAPRGELRLDPHLPEWLPWVTVRELRVGRASVDLRFNRGPSAETRVEVLRQSGALRIRHPAHHLREKAA